MAAKPEALNNDEDLKVIEVIPIESLFSNINLDKDGTGDDSTLAGRCPNDLEFIDLDEMSKEFYGLNLSSRILKI